MLAMADTNLVARVEKAGNVSANEVKRMRSANPNRETPWGVEELGK